jgi:hypothetical protein
MAPGIGSSPPVPSFKAPTKDLSPSKSTSVFHHSLVTENSDALKFHAAASLQLQFGNRHDNIATSDDLLIVSPYNEPLHLLDLKALDIPNRLLAKALTLLKPIRDDYATADYNESFNWQSVVDFVGELADAEGHDWKKQSFYVVVFRSCLQPTADGSRLHDLDSHSHIEAMASGGLLKYWFGTKDENHQNLATCMD